MEIRRDIYLDKLISKKHNRLIKVITGIRRCGKDAIAPLYNDDGVLVMGLFDFLLYESSLDL